MIKYFLLLSLLSFNAFAASGSANVSNVVNLGVDKFGSNTMPITSLTSGTGSSAAAIVKTLTCRMPTTGNAYYNCSDGSGGTNDFQVPANKTFLITNICSRHSATVSAAACQWGYSAAAPTNESTSAPTTPWYSCGAASTYCWVQSTTVGVPNCVGVSIKVPASQYIWVQSNISVVGVITMTGILL